MNLSTGAKLLTKAITINFMIVLAWKILVGAGFQHECRLRSSLNEKRVNDSLLVLYSVHAEKCCTANILDQTQALYVALALHHKASKPHSDGHAHV